MSKKTILPAILMILMTLLGFALTQKAQAPEVHFKFLNGETLTSSQLRGKVVLVDFWATTCPGCIAEMPRLIETYHRFHPQGFEMVAVAMSYDDPDQVRSFAKKHAFPFPVALDTNGTLSAAYHGVRLTPTAILIDKEGNIIRTVVGELDFTSLSHQLDQELGRAG